MIIFKKAAPEDCARLAIAIMQLKKTDENIVEAEMMELINHCYYAQDTETGAIVAVVVAIRELVKYSSIEDDGYGEDTFANRYILKYLAGDPYAISSTNMGYTMQNVLVYLVRELVNDMNDWAVWADTDTLYEEDNDDYNKAIHIALRSNNFVSHVNKPNIFIRVMPIDFDAIH